MNAPSLWASWWRNTKESYWQGISAPRAGHRPRGVCFSYLKGLCERGQGLEYTVYPPGLESERLHFLLDVGGVKSVFLVKSITFCWVSCLAGEKYLPPNKHANTTGYAEQRAMALRRSILFKPSVPVEGDPAALAALKFPSVLHFVHFFPSHKGCVWKTDAAKQNNNNKKKKVALRIVPADDFITCHLFLCWPALCFSWYHRILLHPASDLIKDGSED